MLVDSTGFDCLSTFAISLDYFFDYLMKCPSNVTIEGTSTILNI